MFVDQCPSCIEKVEMPDTICYKCWETIKFITKEACLSCSKPFVYLTNAEYCSYECYANKNKLSEIRAATLYTETIAKIIHKFKYEDKTHLTKILSKLLWHAFCHLKQSDIDIMIPVPIHRIRLRKRGYNQSALLAHIIASRAKKLCSTEVLEKKHHTAAQMMLSEEKRIYNVKNSFVVTQYGSKAIKGLNVLIIDDVITTGATLRECAKVLLQSGAKSVSAISISKA